MMDGMLVGRQALGEMVRETAAAAHLACTYRMAPQDAPHVVRKKYLSQLHQTYKTAMATSAYVTDPLPPLCYVCVASGWVSWVGGCVGFTKACFIERGVACRAPPPPWPRVCVPPS